MGTNFIILDTVNDHDNDPTEILDKLTVMHITTEILKNTIVQNKPAS